MASKHKIRKILVFLTTVFIFSGIVSFFYCYFTTRDEIVVYDQKISNVQSKLVVKLPRVDTYLVKLWGKSYSEKVYLNNTEVVPFRIFTRNNTVEVYIRFDRALVKEGRNVINIFSQNSYSMRIKNFYGSDESRKLFVLFDSSRFLHFDTDLFLNLIFLLFVCLLTAFFLLHYFIRSVFHNLNFFKLFLNFILYNGLCFTVIFILIFIFKVNQYRVILLPPLFLKIACLYICVSILFSFFTFLFKNRHKINLNFKARLLLCKVLRFSTSERNDIGFFLEHIILKIRASSYVFFIGLSVFGLILCLFLVLLELYFLSEIISYLAYFCILAGLISKLSKLRKEAPLE